MDQILLQVQNITVEIVIALIGLAGAYAVIYINKATTKLKEDTAKITDEKQRALVNAAIDRVNDLAYKIVFSTEQTVAGQLREAVKNGTATKEQLLALGQQACEQLYMQLSQEAVKVLEAEVGDVQAYIKSTVEAQVLQLKLTTGQLSIGLQPEIVVRPEITQ